MAITIQMGENPKPTCTISLASSSFNNGTATATFNYTLSAMSGYNYWGYGVVLQYGGSSSLGSSVTLNGTSPSQWSAKSGSVTITKTGVSSSPQYFYFRLNSVASTAGTPGSTSSYSVTYNVDKKTEFGGANDFTLEGTTSAWFTPYKSSYTHNLYIDLINDGNTWVSREGYKSGSTITISDSEILSAYNQLSGYSVGQTVSVKYYLATFSGSTSLGGVSLWKTMTIGGTSKINIGGSWKKAIPYVKVNGSWKPTISYVKSSSNWKRGQV